MHMIFSLPDDDDPRLHSVLARLQEEEFKHIIAILSSSKLFKNVIWKSICQDKIPKVFDRGGSRLAHINSIMHEMQERITDWSSKIGTDIVHDNLNRLYQNIFLRLSQKDFVIENGGVHRVLLLDILHAALVKDGRSYKRLKNVYLAVLNKLHSLGLSISTPLFDGASSDRRTLFSIYLLMQDKHPYISKQIKDGASLLSADEFKQEVTHFVTLPEAKSWFVRNRTGLEFGSWQNPFALRLLSCCKREFLVKATDIR